VLPTCSSHFRYMSQVPVPTWDQQTWKDAFLILPHTITAGSQVCITPSLCFFFSFLFLLFFCFSVQSLMCAMKLILPHTITAGSQLSATAPG
jgi:hypothetical protein